MKKQAYGPAKIIDKRLPFSIDITSDVKIYAVSSKGRVLCDYIKLKNPWRIIIKHNGFEITITGYDEINNKFVYTIKEL